MSSTPTIFTFSDQDPIISYETILTKDLYVNTATLTSVTVGSEVTAFADSCFQYCTSLTTIDFQYSTTNLESFGPHCFDGCSSIDNINTPTTVNKLGLYCFANCTLLRNVNIANNTRIAELPDYCFYRCYNYLSDTSYPNSHYPNCIPANVTYLGAYCFSICYSIYTVFIPSSVTDISNNCFEGCDSIGVITFGDEIKIKSFSDYCFNGCFNQRDTTTITIPDSVESFGAYCFAHTGDNSAYTQLNIIFTSNSQIQTFGNYCFYDSYIQSINIPKTLESLPNYCFNNCRKLISVTFDDNSKIESFGNNCFSYSTIESIIIPNSVKTIDTECFNECVNLSSIYFQDNSMLESIGGIDETGGYSFTRCIALNSITIPSNVTYLNNGSFIECTALNTVTYLNPASITIGYGIFMFDNPMAVYFCNTSEIPDDEPDTIYDSSIYPNGSALIPVDGTSTIFTFFSDNTYTYKNSSENILRQSSYDNKTTTLISVIVGSDVTAFDDSCFKDCTSLTTIDFQYSTTKLESFGLHCFDGCIALNSITIPSNVTYLGNGSFAECTALNTVTYLNPGNITINVDSGIFNGDNQMTVYFCKTITIPDPASPTTVYDSNIYPTGSVLIPVAPGDAITTGSELITFMNDTSVPNCYIFNPIAIDSELLSASSKSLFATKSDVTIVRN